MILSGSYSSANSCNLVIPTRHCTNVLIWKLYIMFCSTMLHLRALSCYIITQLIQINNQPEIMYRYRYLIRYHFLEIQIPMPASKSTPMRVRLKLPSSNFFILVIPYFIVAVFFFFWFGFGIFSGMRLGNLLSVFTPSSSIHKNILNSYERFQQILH